MRKSFLLFILSCTALFGRETELLFVLQDAGETQSLLPVMELLEKDYAVLAGGVAEEQLSKIEALKDRLIRYKDVGIEQSVDKSWGRAQRLSKDEIARIADEIHAKKVITGVAFEMHGQLLEEYAARGSRTLAYWDNINPTGSDPYFATAKKVALIAQTLLVPTSAFHKTFPRSITVGQPSLEKWRGQLEKIDCGAVKAKMPYLTGKPVLVYVGGYGAEYEEAFSLFAEALPLLSDYDVVVSFHPKTGGVFENSKIESMPHVRLLQGATTQEAVAIASKVVCHQSTAGVQAAAAGKEVYYLVPASQNYTNPLIENGFAPLCSSAQQLRLCLDESRKAQGDFFSALGLAKESAQLIRAKLVE